MNILIVYCHPTESSFNHAILQSVTEELNKSGHEYQVADLYKEGFHPAFVPQDYAQFKGKPMPDDVLREQERVEWSDGLIFIFPVWWWSIPAMLKGWIDRVMSYGWAWEDPNDPDSGHLKARKILVLTTAGASEKHFAKRKYDQSFYTQLNVGTWSYCGMNDVTTKIFHEMVPGISEDYTKECLNKAKELTRELIS